MNNKIIQDVNLNLQYQNDSIKKELIEKNQYINILENENENLKNKYTQLETELTKLRESIELEKEKEKEKEFIKNTTILNYIWNGFKN